MRIAKEDSMGNNIEIKKSPAMRAYGYLTMDEFFGSFEASLKTAEQVAELRDITVEKIYG